MKFHIIRDTISLALAAILPASTIGHPIPSRVLGIPCRAAIEQEVAVENSNRTADYLT